MTLPWPNARQRTVVGTLAGADWPRITWALSGVIRADDPHAWIASRRLVATCLGLTWPGRADDPHAWTASKCFTWNRSVGNAANDSKPASLVVVPDLVERLADPRDHACLPVSLAPHPGTLP